MMVIRVHIGSIVDPAVGAHAIVNASNPHVALGSGVSAAIRAACGGQAYQRELTGALEEEFGRTLKAGECLVTGSGKSSAFRWVLHVPAVDYDQDDPETGGATGPGRVRACVRRALEEAATLARANGLVGQFVIAFPLLGAGAGGLGEARSARAMLDAIASDAFGGGDLRAIVFVVLGEQQAGLVRAYAAANRLELG